jgi:hypothetical protein
MEQADSRLNSVLHHLHYDVIIMLDTLLVDWPVAEWEDSGPRNAGRVPWDTHGLESGKVLLIQVVVLAEHIAGAVIGNLIWHTVGEEIPDGWTTALILCSAFNLVGRGTETPCEARWELLVVKLRKGARNKRVEGARAN